jgi:hypothetical protein
MGPLRNAFPCLADDEAVGGQWVWWEKTVVEDHLVGSLVFGQSFRKCFSQMYACGFAITRTPARESIPVSLVKFSFSSWARVPPKDLVLWCVMESKILPHSNTRAFVLCLAVYLALSQMAK